MTLLKRGDKVLIRRSEFGCGLTDVVATVLEDQQEGDGAITWQGEFGRNQTVIEYVGPAQTEKDNKDE